jgi:hypothetical protein
MPERCPFCNFLLREHFENQRSASGEANDEEELDAP